MKTLGLFFILFLVSNLNAQDTFSIVAVDSITGEVGSAGASCVDLSSFPGFSDSFLGELFPGEGAINTQAAYLGANQTNARNRMNLGDTPSEIIAWLEANDVGGSPAQRQYGIVRLTDGSPESAAYSGDATLDYSNHIIGPNYAIQGNILLGQQVLDSMEARFLRAEGDLACKLMAAMQGANIVGADSRCADNGTSSLFAFLKVAQPSDVFGEPSFEVSVRTSDGAGIEPIDSLQVLFDAEENCGFTNISKPEEITISVRLYPNPAKDYIQIETSITTDYLLEVVDNSGIVVLSEIGNSNYTLSLEKLAPGTYTLKLKGEEGQVIKRFVKK